MIFNSNGECVSLQPECCDCDCDIEPASYTCEITSVPREDFECEEGNECTLSW